MVCVGLCNVMVYIRVCRQELVHYTVYQFCLFCCFWFSAHALVSIENRQTSSILLALVGVVVCMCLPLEKQRGFK